MQETKRELSLAETESLNNLSNGNGLSESLAVVNGNGQATSLKLLPTEGKIASSHNGNHTLAKQKLDAIERGTARSYEGWR